MRLRRNKEQQPSPSTIEVANVPDAMQPEVLEARFRGRALQIAENQLSGVGYATAEKFRRLGMDKQGPIWRQVAGEVEQYLDENWSEDYPESRKDAVRDFIKSIVVVREDDQQWDAHDAHDPAQPSRRDEAVEKYQYRVDEERRSSPELQQSIEAYTQEALAIAQKFGKKTGKRPSRVIFDFRKGDKECAELVELMNAVATEMSLQQEGEVDDQLAAAIDTRLSGILDVAENALIEQEKQGGALGKFGLTRRLGEKWNKLEAEHHVISSDHKFWSKDTWKDITNVERWKQAFSKEERKKYAAKSAMIMGSSAVIGAGIAAFGPAMLAGGVAGLATIGVKRAAVSVATMKLAKAGGGANSHRRENLRGIVADIDAQMANEDPSDENSEYYGKSAYEARLGAWQQDATEKVRRNRKSVAIAGSLAVLGGTIGHQIASGFMDGDARASIRDSLDKFAHANPNNPYTNWLGDRGTVEVEGGVGDSGTGSDTDGDTSGESSTSDSPTGNFDDINGGTAAEYDLDTDNDAPVADPVQEYLDALPEEAQTIERGDGLYDVFRRLDIDSEHHQDLLDKVGPEIDKEYPNLVYFDETANEWRLGPASDMPEGATRIILESANENGWLDTATDATPEVVETVEGEPFMVEDGHGYTHELMQAAEAKGVEVTPLQAWEAHQTIVDKEGPDYINKVNESGTPKTADVYPMGDSKYEVGISESAKHTWDPKAAEMVYDFADDGEINGSYEASSADAINPEQSEASNADTMTQEELAEAIRKDPDAVIPDSFVVDPSSASPELDLTAGDIRMMVNDGQLDMLEKRLDESIVRELAIDLQGLTYDDADNTPVVTRDAFGRYGFNPLPENTAMPDSVKLAIGQHIASKYTPAA